MPSGMVLTLILNDCRHQEVKDMQHRRLGKIGATRHNIRNLSWCGTSPNDI